MTYATDATRKVQNEPGALWRTIITELAYFQPEEEKLKQRDLKEAEKQNRRQKETQSKKSTCGGG
jgi:hypothetical protein